MPQTRFAQTVCHFSHNADFDQLRISKYPANAHEINYFSMLVVGSFKYTLTESGKSPAEQLFGVKLRSKADDFIRLTQKEGIICVRKNLKWNVRD